MLHSQLTVETGWNRGLLSVVPVGTWDPCSSVVQPDISRNRRSTRRFFSQRTSNAKPL